MALLVNPNSLKNCNSFCAFSMLLIYQHTLTIASVLLSTNWKQSISCIVYLHLLALSVNYDSDFNKQENEMSLANLKKLKQDYHFDCTAKDYLLETILNSTIELLEQNQPQEVTSADRKWEPLSEGFHCFSGYQSQKDIIDDALFCETEQDAIDKHKLLRSVSRLDSVIREYGTYKFINGVENYYIYFDVVNGKYDCQWHDRFKVTGVIYHTKETMEDVCRRLNDEEIEL